MGSRSQAAAARPGGDVHPLVEQRLWQSVAKQAPRQRQKQEQACLRGRHGPLPHQTQRLRGLLYARHTGTRVDEAAKALGAAERRPGNEPGLTPWCQRIPTAELHRVLREDGNALHPPELYECQLGTRDADVPGDLRKTSGLNLQRAHVVAYSGDAAPALPRRQQQVDRAPKPLRPSAGLVQQVDAAGVDVRLVARGGLQGCVAQGRRAPSRRALVRPVRAGGFV